MSQDSVVLFFVNLNLSYVQELAGLFIADVFSAFSSSLSTASNATATVKLEGFRKLDMKKDLSEKK